jgi:hypothetical protein
LHSVHLDVSYFAAGIVAHLASDGAETWTVPTISRQDVLDELVIFTPRIQYQSLIMDLIAGQCGSKVGDTRR